MGFMVTMAVIRKKIRVLMYRQIKQTGATAKHIFLTIHEDPDFLSEALSTGALGYVVKSHIASDLIPAIHEALAGRIFVSSFQSTEGNG